MANEIRLAFNSVYSDGPGTRPTQPDKSRIREEVGGTIQTQVDSIRELAEGSAAGYVVAATWAGLAAISGTRQGQPGRVPTSDAGTHTDPVAGGTVKNSGEFSWNISPAGWRRVGDAFDPLVVEQLIEGKQAALPELISFDRKVRIDQRGIVDGTARIYLPRRVYYRRGDNLLDVTTWGTESTKFPGFVEKLIPNTVGDTIYVYIDLDDAADPVKVATGTTQPPVDRPGRVINIMSLFSRGYVQSRVDFEEVTETGGSRLVPRYDLAVDAGKLLVPQSYHSDFDGNAERVPSDGSQYWEADIPQGLFGPNVTGFLWDDLAAAAGTNPIKTIANTQTLEGGIKFPLIARALNGRVTSPYTIATTVPNLWEAGNDPDNADWLETNCFVADSPTELATAGFPRCVKVTGSNNVYYGGDLDEPTAGGEYVFGRVWVHTDIANDFGTPILYLKGTTADAQQLTGRIEKKISTTLAIFQYSGRMVPGARAVRFLIGCLQNDQGASKLAGGQLWIGAEQNPYIARADHAPPKASMRPTIGKTLFMVQGRALPLYLDNIIGAHDDRSLVTGGLWSIKSGTAAYPYMAEGDRKIFINPDTIGTAAHLTIRKKGVSGRKTMRFDASITVSVASIPKTASPKILMIADSIGNRQGPAKTDAKVVANGLTPIWVGTVNTSTDDNATTTSSNGTLNASGPLAECREGIEFAEYVYAAIDSGTPQPVTDPSAYIAGAKATKITMNPFLRVATGSDPADRVFNGYIFDFAAYLSTYSVPTPDVVIIGLGTNDRGKRSASVSPAQTAEAARVMILQIRAGAPSAKIGWWMPATPRTHLRDEDWAEHISIIRSVMAAIYALADANVFVIPAWAHMSSEIGWRLAENATYPVLAADNVRASIVDDETHLGVGPAPLREQMAEVLSAFITNVA